MSSNREQNKTRFQHNFYEFNKSLLEGRLDLFFLEYNIDKDFIDNIDLSNINYLNLNMIKFSNKQYLIDLMNRLDSEKEYNLELGDKYNKNISESFNQIIDIFIEKNIKIKKLKYYSFEFDLIHIEKIKNYLFNQNCLEVLSISMNESIFLPNLINNLIIYDKIVDLEFNFSLQNNQIYDLCEYIKITTSLKKLSIHWCKMEKREQIILSDYLLINNSIESLSLININLFDLSLISDLIKKNTLKELRLYQTSDNIKSDITITGWDSFFDSIKNNNSIEKLDLVYLKLNYIIMNQLFESLLYNNSIKILFLFNNFNFKDSENDNINLFNNVIKRKILEELYIGSSYTDISYAFQNNIINSIINTKHNLKKLYIKTGKFDLKLWKKMNYFIDVGKNIDYISNRPNNKYNNNILSEVFNYIKYIPKNCDIKIIDSLKS